MARRKCKYGKLKQAKGRRVCKLKPRQVGFTGGHQGQIGTRISIRMDRARKALLPGYRYSKSGKRYLERRKNRSDLLGSRL